LHPRLHSNALPSADDDDNDDHDHDETTPIIIAKPHPIRTRSLAGCLDCLVVLTVNAAFFIAGTTVGVGFLTLPIAVAAPSGFVPSATALVGIWAFFWVKSLMIIECLCVCQDQG
jgi:hypothetical protein